MRVALHNRSLRRSTQQQDLFEKQPLITLTVHATVDHRSTYQKQEPSGMILHFLLQHVMNMLFVRFQVRNVCDNTWMWYYSHSHLKMLLRTNSSLMFFRCHWLLLLLAVQSWAAAGDADGLCCQKEYCSGQQFSFLLISLRHTGFSQRQNKNVTHSNEQKTLGSALDNWWWSTRTKEIYCSGRYVHSSNEHITWNGRFICTIYHVCLKCRRANIWHGVMDRRHNAR